MRKLTWHIRTLRQHLDIKLDNASFNLKRNNILSSLINIDIFLWSSKYSKTCGSKWERNCGDALQQILNKVWLKLQTAANDSSLAAPSTPAVKMSVCIFGVHWILVLYLTTVIVSMIKGTIRGKYQNCCFDGGFKSVWLTAAERAEPRVRRREWRRPWVKKRVLWSYKGHVSMVLAEEEAQHQLFAPTVCLQAILSTATGQVISFLADKLTLEQSTSISLSTWGFGDLFNKPWGSTRHVFMFCLPDKKKALARKPVRLLLKVCKSSGVLEVVAWLSVTICIATDVPVRFAQL